MNTIKTTTLSTFAILACAMLLLAPDFYRDGASRDNPLSRLATLPEKQPRSAIHVEPGKRLDPARQQSLRFAQDISRAEATAIPIETQPADWTLALYPDLARIEALENEPAYTALGELSPMLSSGDPVVRLAAIEALGDITLKEALPGLMAALRDPDSQLRVAALEALAVHGDQSVAGAIESVLFDSEQEVRVAAIETLADLESEVSVHALASLLSDPDASIRHQAVYALGEIGGRDAMMYLLQARYDPVATIRKNADAILAELEYEAAY